ncbi:hypothetical protein DM02DRAFT_635491 [Periconia macrospinosa]|uniref:Myb-like domain-containing protein n=1 Tax=Periconia macrospinosa TaxID=97972 RepID=A0A2V1D2N1_9PLEO|nr:hypothetical protein DM02DRAFT_635491 [Periconia macrospinosa]
MTPTTRNDDDEEYEEDSGKYKICAAEGSIPCSQRTRELSVGSDKGRLLSYKDNMSMEWKDICEHIPDRSPDAVKPRYYTHALQERLYPVSASSSATYSMRLPYSIATRKTPWTDDVSGEGRPVSLPRIATAQVDIDVSCERLAESGSDQYA